MAHLTKADIASSLAGTSSPSSLYVFSFLHEIYWDGKTDRSFAFKKAKQLLSSSVSFL